MLLCQTENGKVKFVDSVFNHSGIRFDKLHQEFTRFALYTCFIIFHESYIKYYIENKFKNKAHLTFLLYRFFYFK